MHFNHIADPDNLDMCPKTLEYETLTREHVSSVVHAVALWLEKIYEQDPSLVMKELDIGQKKGQQEFDDQRPKSDQAEKDEL